MTCEAEIHGTLYAYHTKGCRCPETRRLTMVAEKRRRLFRARTGHGMWLPGIGTARRLQALATLGYSTRALAAEMGTTQKQLRRMQSGEYRVHIKSANAVRALYGRLWMTTADLPRMSRTTNHAARMGWVSPWCWDDDTIDDPTALPDFGGAKPLPDPMVVGRALRAGSLEGVADVDRIEVVRQLIATGSTTPGKVQHVLNLGPATARRLFGLATQSEAA